MRSHPEINKKVNVMNITDIKQFAMMQGKQVVESKDTFNNERVYKMSGTEGLFTFTELKNLFTH